MKNIKIIALHAIIEKIMKILTFEARIMELMKTIITSFENHKTTMKMLDSNAGIKKIMT